MCSKRLHLKNVFCTYYKLEEENVRKDLNLFIFYFYSNRFFLYKSVNMLQHHQNKINLSKKTMNASRNKERESCVLPRRIFMNICRSKGIVFYDEFHLIFHSPLTRITSSSRRIQSDFNAEIHGVLSMITISNNFSTPFDTKLSHYNAFNTFQKKNLKIIKSVYEYMRR